MGYRLGNAPLKVKQKLFLSQCLHSYGAETWNFSSNETDTFWKASGQAARRVVGLPPCCPSSFVDTLYGAKVVKTATFKKFLGLVKALKESKNEKTNYMFHVAMSDARSLIRKNMAIVQNEWGGLTVPPFRPDVSPECLGIQELVGVRQGSYSLDAEQDDIDQFVMLLCMR